MRSTPWGAEFEELVIALGEPGRPPAELLQRLKALQLGPDNSDAHTLSILYKLADVAFKMAIELMKKGGPGDHEHNHTPPHHIEALFGQDSPQAYYLATTHMISSQPRGSRPTGLTRRNVAQLIYATRVVARSPEDSTGSMSRITTARFLAMWASIYGEFEDEEAGLALALEAIPAAPKAETLRWPWWR